MKTLLLSALSALSIFAHSQQAVVSGGGDAFGTVGSVSYSIGQIAYSHSADGLINEGVQQPFEIFSISVDDKFQDFQLNIFPNPTSNALIIAMENYSPGVSASVLSADGRLIDTILLISSVTSIDVSSLPAANYFIRLTNEAGNTANYQVVKH
jgi:hypothetical protein